MKIEFLFFRHTIFESIIIDIFMSHFYINDQNLVLTAFSNIFNFPFNINYNILLNDLLYQVKIFPYMKFDIT